MSRVSSFAANLVLLTTLLAAPSARADVTACLEEDTGKRLEVVAFVTEGPYLDRWSVDQLRTGSDGCVTVQTTRPEVSLTFHAQNPVVGMVTGRFEYTPPLGGWWGVVPVEDHVDGVRDGDGIVIRSSDEGFSLAGQFRTMERLRQIHDDVLARDFSQLSAPVASDTTQHFIEVWDPDALPQPLAFVEPHRPETGYPLMHLKPDAYSHTTSTLAHELGHALHFANLSRETRSTIQSQYLGWLLGEILPGMPWPEDGEATHHYDVRTSELIAFIEAFGLFTETYHLAATYEDDSDLDDETDDEIPETCQSLPRNSPDERERRFYCVASSPRWWGLIDPTDSESGGGFNAHPDWCDRAECKDQSLYPLVAGADVEGAVFLALFVHFASRVEGGLQYVVNTLLECESLTINQYASCIAGREGVGSLRYQLLVEAGRELGIEFEATGELALGVVEADDRFGTTLASGDFDGNGVADTAIGHPQTVVTGAGDHLRGVGRVDIVYGGLLEERVTALDQGLAAIPGEAAAGNEFGKALVAADFDGDGFDDLAIGAPGDRVGNAGGAGRVVVVYGSQTHGLTLARVRGFSQSGAVVGGPEPDDGFGSALAAGDFDGNGAADLAVGVPGEDLGSDAATADVGLVNVLYGQRGVGLGDAGNQSWHQSYSASSGQTLASSGAVTNRESIAESAERGDGFGHSLAAADFDRNGAADLAVGVPYETVAGVSKAGAVHVIHGGEGGLGRLRNQLWYQRRSSVSGQSYKLSGTTWSYVLNPPLLDLAEADDRFGWSLAAADIEADGAADLLIGVPYEDLPSGPADAGLVHVLYGTRLLGLSASGNQTWHQTRSGAAGATAGIGANPPINGSAEPDDRFGFALVMGDFNGDHYADAAIGVPYENATAFSSEIADAGMVNVLYGSDCGLSALGNQGWHAGRLRGAARDTVSDPALDRFDPAAPADNFGYAMAAGDANGDDIADLAVGVPGRDSRARVPAYEAFVMRTDSGGVNVLFGVRPFNGVSLPTLTSGFGTPVLTTGGGTSSTGGTGSTSSTGSSGGLSGHGTYCGTLLGGEYNGLTSRMNQILR